MSFRKRIKNRLNEELPYSPSYSEFAKTAGLAPKMRKKVPVYHSLRRRVATAVLIFVAAIGVIGAVVPTVVAINAAPTDVSPLRYRPKTLERIGEITAKTSQIYQNFVKIAVKQFFTLNQENEVSKCISLPDLFFSYSMLATISGDSIQTSFLESIGAESISQLKAASNELASFLVFLEKADEEEESDYGSFNLNGFFYDPSSKLKGNHDEYLQDFSNYYNSYSFSSKPTEELVEKWQKDGDQNGYLLDAPDAKYNEESKISIISNYTVIDAFSPKESASFQADYEVGDDVSDFWLEDGSKRGCDFLSLASSDNIVTTGEDFQSFLTSINQTDMRIYLPSEDVDIDEFATTVMDEKETIEATMHNLQLFIPMFTIETSVNEPASTLLPEFSGNDLASNFIEEEEKTCYLSQHNKLTLDYYGFKGSVGEVDKSLFIKPSNTFDSYIDRPFVFSVSYKGVDLYYGKVHDPNYPLSPAIAS